MTHITYRKKPNGDFIFVGKTPKAKWGMIHAMAVDPDSPLFKDAAVAWDVKPENFDAIMAKLSEFEPQETGHAPREIAAKLEREKPGSQGGPRAFTPAKDQW